MNKPNAPPWVPISRVVIAGALLLSCGSYYFHQGVLVLLTGQTLIVGRHFQPFVAYASGPHAEAFNTHTYSLLGFGSLAILAGLALPGSLLLMQPKRKAAFLELFNSSSTGASGHTPWIAAVAVSLVLVRLLVLRVMENL